jgi:exonuclease III
LTANFIETDHYFWKMANARTRPQYGMSMSGGTAILLHKSRKPDFEDLEFLDVTENILAYKCAFFGRPLQIISVYVPDDETGKPEFAELISYLVKTGDRAVTNIVMGDFHAEIGKHDAAQDLKIGQMVSHRESNINGILLKGLLELTKFELHSSFGSDSVLSTCVDVAKSREMQWDHVIVSHYDDFVVGQSQADWLDDIPTNHKAVFTEFTVKDKAVVPIVEPVTVEIVPEEDPKRLKVVSWDIAGSLDFHDPADLDATLTFCDSSEDSCTLAASIVCLQNTGLKDEVLETKNYKWRNLPGSGTAILFRKTLLDQVRPVNFKTITDCILESTFVWRGQRCRLISAYIPEGGELEFTQLLTHLVTVQDGTVFTAVMGNMNAEVGRQDQEKLGDDTRLGRMLTHRCSNENGQYLLGLLNTTQYRLMTSVSSSKTVLTTSRRSDGSKSQINHVICSTIVGLAANLTATWCEAIRSDHKMLRLYVEAQGSRAVSPLPRPSMLTKRTYASNQRLVVGSLNMNGLCATKENVLEFEAIFEREPAPSEPFEVLCLQNTGLRAGDLHTHSFQWHTSSGGTTIVVSKKLSAQFIDQIKFFEITDHILVCELVIFGKRLRLISFFAPNGGTAKSEFTTLISCLNEPINKVATTVLMGDFKAMVGRNDQYGQPDYDLTGYENLPHDTSNENGILLKGLIRLTDYRLESALCLSRTMQNTCETLDDRLVQVDHVLASPNGDFIAQVVMAKWLREIATNHKILITHIVHQPKAAGEGAKRACFGRV